MNRKNIILRRYGMLGKRLVMDKWDILRVGLICLALGLYVAAVIHAYIRLTTLVV